MSVRTGLNAVLAGPDRWIRLALLLAAISLTVLGKLDAPDVGGVQGGCSPSNAPLLKPTTSKRPHAVSYCSLKDADVMQIEAGPILPGTSQVTLNFAGYGDGPGLSAALVGDDGTEYAVSLPVAGERWLRKTVPIPSPLQSQRSRLVLRDASTLGYGWIGLGIASPFDWWRPAALALLLLAAIYPWLHRRDPVTPARSPVTSGRKRWQRWLIGIGVSVATIAAMWLRRPMQFSNPYVWIEDGRDLIPEFLHHGWATLLHPVAGYILIPNKLINAVSIMLSFRWLPEISLALATLFTVGSMLAVALAPTRLRAGWACVLAVLLVPTDPEVFSTSAYVLWWAGFLVVVPLFWDERAAPSLQLRLPMLLIGAFSSPLIVLMAPLYLLRALALRQRGEWLMLLAAGVSAVVQASLVLGNQTGAPPLVPDVSAVLERFFGYYLYWTPLNSRPAATLGIGTGLALILLVAAWAQRRRDPLVLIGLYGCFAVSIAATLARVPLDVLDPYLAGPRYFFYPYVFLAWILIHLTANARGAGKVFFLVLLLAPLAHSLGPARIVHAPLDWREQVRSCSSESTADGPAVHQTGKLEHLWRAPLSAEECRTLVTRSLFDNRLAPEDLPPLPPR